MLAVQAAALAAMTNAKLSGASSIGQAQLEYSFFQVVGTNCFLPVTFTLMCLHVYGKKSWYIFAFSFCAFVLSTVTFFLSFIATNDTQSVSASEGLIERCGNLNPTSMCTLDLILNSRYGKSGLSGFSEVSGLYGFYGYFFSATIMMFIIVDQLNIVGLLVFKRMISRITPTEGSPRAKVTYVCIRISKVLLCVVLFIRFVINFGTQVNSLTWYMSSNVITKDWGIGQIIGITIWTQPLVEYIYLEFCKYPHPEGCERKIKRCLFLILDSGGITKGFDYRLALGLSVTKNANLPTSPRTTFGRVYTMLRTSNPNRVSRSL